MTDDPKDTTNQSNNPNIENQDSNPNQTPKREVKVTELVANDGILKGKKYTCFKDMDEDFGGEYQYAYAVTDGNIITGVSAAASIEFAFAILEKLCGKEHTEKVKASIYYDAKH